MITETMGLGKSCECSERLLIGAPLAEDNRTLCTIIHLREFGSWSDSISEFDGDETSSCLAGSEAYKTTFIPLNLTQCLASQVAFTNAPMRANAECGYLRSPTEL